MFGNSEKKKQEELARKERKIALDYVKSIYAKCICMDEYGNELVDSKKVNSRLVLTYDWKDRPKEITWVEPEIREPITVTRVNNSSRRGDDDYVSGMGDVMGTAIPGGVVTLNGDFVPNSNITQEFIQENPVGLVSVYQQQENPWMD